VCENYEASALDRVGTILEILEYSGMSLNMENSENSVQPQGKIITNNKVFLVRHSNICVKHGQSVLVICYIAGVDYCWS